MNIEEYCALDDSSFSPLKKINNNLEIFVSFLALSIEDGPENKYLAVIKPIKQRINGRNWPYLIEDNILERFIKRNVPRDRKIIACEFYFRHYDSLKKLFHSYANNNARRIRLIHDDGTTTCDIVTAKDPSIRKLFEMADRGSRHISQNLKNYLTDKHYRGKYAIRLRKAIREKRKSVKIENINVMLCGLEDFDKTIKIPSMPKRGFSEEV